MKIGQKKTIFLWTLYHIGHIYIFMNAKELKGIRDRLGMTQTDLAKRLKMTWRTVARWEAGAKIPETVCLALREVVRQETN